MKISFETHQIHSEFYYGVICNFILYNKSGLEI